MGPKAKRGGHKATHKTYNPAPTVNSEALIQAQLDSGKYFNSLLGTAERFLKQGERAAAHAGCNDMTANKTALIDLAHAIEVYNMLINLGPYDRNMATISASRDHALAYFSKVRANIAACALMKDKNFNNANKLINQTANLSVDDQQLFAKIEASEKTNPCGFKTFDDYAGGQRYKEFLDRTIITPYKYDNFKASIGRKGLGIMFYGPPGTGKTLLTEAMASSLNARYFYVSGSELKSKYSGDAEKSVKYAFEIARKATMGGKVPVELVFDEADSLFGDNSGEGNRSGLTTTILQQTEGVGMDNTGVIFIFITNSPRGIPDAVRSRCSEQIYIGFPGLDNIRESIINKLNRVGRVRYNFNIHYVDGKDKEGKPTKVIRRQWIDNYLLEHDYDESNDQRSGAYKVARDQMWDDIDAMTLQFYDANASKIGTADYYPAFYSQRQIDQVFNKMDIMSAYRAARFYQDEAPSGIKEPSQQLWIADRSTYTVTETIGNACVRREHQKSALIPIAYGTQTSGPGVIGVVFDKLGPKSDPKKGIRRVVTRREKAGEYWVYRLIAEEDDNGRLQLESGDGKLLDNMQSILGHSQMNWEDFVAAFQQSSPTTLEHPEELLDYLLKNNSGSEEDRKRIKDLVEGMQNLKNNNPREYQKLKEANDPDFGAVAKFMQQLTKAIAFANNEYSRTGREEEI